MGDAKRLREYSQGLLKSPLNSLQQFPGNEVFDWERELGDENNIKLLYRFAELEEFAKDRPGDQCIGYLSVIVVELNLVSLCVDGNPVSPSYDY
ncbi:hypothetical protein Q9L58_009932 [Maublancomyces gigas]|uniref:Uncharacterized protein n=1 Tax=Discina gigas TaxID=1032678 RepID=A0ABR3G5J9_9PEZI